VKHTERLIIREFKDSDWTAVHQYAIRPEVYQFMPWGPNTEEQTKEFIEKAIKDKEIVPRVKYEFAIVIKEMNQLIGGCGIKIDPLNEKNCEIGYCLSSDYWGNNYAAEAAEVLIDFAFNTLNMHRVFALVDTENHRSIRVLEKLKFRKEGHFKEHKLVRSEWRDEFIYAILTSEWKAK
jgi:RimJ/RimL family protein N-acetyltransferase